MSGRNDVTFKERIAMEDWYVTNWNLWIDLIILYKTFKVVFSKKGAY